MVTLGIDPGITGGLAFIEDRALLALYDMPTVTDANGKRRPSAPGIAALIRQHAPARAIIERVNAMPSQGAKRTMGAQSMFNFGRGFGAVEAAIALSDVPITYTLPRTWKARAGIPARASKDYARTLALQLHPAADLHKKRDIGKADALLIAIFGQ